MVLWLLALVHVWATSHDVSFPAQQLDSVEVYGSGEIQVTGSDLSSARVQGTSRNCELTSKIVGRTLHVFYPTNTRETVCNGKLTVSVPKALALRHSGPSSDLSISGMEGEIAVNQRVGNVLVEGTRGPLSVKMAKGTVRGHHLSGNLDLWLGQGDAQFDLDRVMPGSRVTLMTGEASVDLVLPPGSQISTKRRQKFGTLVSDFPESQKPAMTIAMRSETGNLKIRAATPLLP